MDGQVRARPTHAEELRCPYCHDMLQAAAEELIECPGCGTLHHGVCISELGRCTVMGCAQPITREALPLPQHHESPTMRRERDKLRGRVMSFVGERARAARESDRVPRTEPDLASRSRRALWLALGITVLPGVVVAMLLAAWYVVPGLLGWLQRSPVEAAILLGGAAGALGLCALLTRSAVKVASQDDPRPSPPSGPMSSR